MRGSIPPDISNDINNLKSLLNAADQHVENIEGEVYGRKASVVADPKVNLNGKIESDQTSGKSIKGRQASKITKMKAELKQAQRILDNIIKKLDERDIQVVQASEVKPTFRQTTDSSSPQSLPKKTSLEKRKVSLSSGVVKVGFKGPNANLSNARLRQSGKVSSGGHSDLPKLMVEKRKPGPEQLANRQPPPVSPGQAQPRGMSSTAANPPQTASIVSSGSSLPQGQPTGAPSDPSGAPPLSPQPPPYSGNAPSGSNRMPPPSPPPPYSGSASAGGHAAATQSGSGMGQGLPEYHGILSSVLTSLAPKKLLEGGSRNPHNPKCVALLDPDKKSSFAQRNDKLKKLEELKPEARNAEAFEQNNKCREFMNFLLDPRTAYRAKRLNKQLDVPVSGTGSNIKCKSRSLEKLVREKRKSSAEANGKKIGMQEAIMLVRDDLEQECKPFHQYLSDKVIQKQREDIKNELVNEKEVYKEEILAAKAKETKKILNKDELLTQLNTDHDLNLTDDDLKKESTVNHILKKLEDKKEDAKTKKHASKRKISNYSFFRFLSFFTKVSLTERKESTTLPDGTVKEEMVLKESNVKFPAFGFSSLKAKRAKLKRLRAYEKQEKISIENELVNLKKCVAKVNMLESDIDGIEEASRKLLHDLDTDITRTRRQLQ